MEEAIDQARTEYKASVYGKVKMLEYMAENDLLKKNMGETIKVILEKGMEVKLFFLEKADQIIEGLQKDRASATILETVLEKLTGLDEDCLEFDFNGKLTRIKEPEAVRAIRDRWRSIVPDAYSGENKESRIRTQTIEEDIVALILVLNITNLFVCHGNN